ncbi:hypothetical protein CCAX7_41100 [Capsulimonas corticalis]|uniref:Uncharacterized protein n=1 Tax=Capsulimonas corticalis TaxID=2219043 RepID=A0A402D6B2_9BACT|nr:hypothetical protein [Capsulimonas corticalis]BDI32059.1 hypothetical protein CCAX7_41100 [Capsulimonas corticalis]
MKTKLLTKRAVKRRAKFATAGRTRRASAEDFAAFEAQTFLHVRALCRDALCLTGNRDDAADLVVAAYARAFREHDQFRFRSASHAKRTPGVLDWLYQCLHAAFCDRILAQRENH